MKTATISKAFNYFVSVSWFPVTVAHELTHAAVGKVCGGDVDITFDLLYWDVGVTVDWGGDVDRWKVVATALAPFIAGMVAMVVAIVLWTLNGHQLPDSSMNMAIMGLLAMWWARYAFPSPEDVGVAINDSQKP